MLRYKIYATEKKNYYEKIFNINIDLTIYKIKYISFFLFIISVSSCVRNQNIVPYVYVNQYINISLPSYSSLNAVGGWIYITGGSKGIIVYRQSFDQFSAYDRHCTYNANDPCAKLVLTLQIHL